MVRYLSDEWLQALEGAAGESEPLRQVAEGAQLTVQERITEGPQGDELFYVTLDDGSVTFRRGQHPDPDVTFTQPYDTAVEIGRGTTSAQAAFMVGKITASGRLERLTESAERIEKLHDVFLAVRSRTEY